MITFEPTLTGGPRSRRVLPLALSVALVLAGLIVPAILAAPARAADPGTPSRPTGNVTQDALPTVQIDGVVWSQAVVGNTVYAGGNFANARPAGAAPGTNLTPRSDLLAYDITTGALITSFAPTLNGQVKSVVASPDGTRVYVGGSFTQVNGQNRYRLAAFDTTTGALVAAFHPTLDATVNSITATNSTVYVGGIFGTANGVSRSRLAAFSASTGATLGWAPTTDNVVDAVQLTPSGNNVVVGGAFQTVNGATALGLASVNATDGSMVPFAANQVVKDYGSTAAILSLSVDATTVYGTGYSYGSVGNFEGVFGADPDTGAITSLEDCHGDTYGTYSNGTQVYVVSHEHYCANIGGFPDTNPRSAWYRSTVFTAKATGTVAHNAEGGYADFYGQPAPSLLNWFPSIDVGTFTGQNQGSWTVNGNSQYVVEGGEFQHINGTPQQGLVRFAMHALAPNKFGPTGIGTASLQSSAATPGVTIAASAGAYDPDDQYLTYNLVRSDVAIPVATAVLPTVGFWQQRPPVVLTDPSAVSGIGYTYRITAVDPGGTTVSTNTVTLGGPAPNVPPRAAATGSCQAVTCTFDASGSNDPDGSLVSYSWQFGDGTNGTGVKPVHVYAAAGTYTATVTVTDNSGATASANTTVTPSSAVTSAADTFSRTTTSGWGTADTGGAWTITGGASLFSVAGGVGRIGLNAAGASPGATLVAVSMGNSVQTVDVSSDKDATGNGYYLTLRSRIAGTTSYQLKLRFLPGGVVHLIASKVVNGTETIFREVNIAAVTNTVNSPLRLRFATTGDGTTTTLAGTVWPVGATQPATPQLSVTDTEPGLQGPGAVGLSGYASASTTNAPITLSLDNYSAG